MSWYIAKIVFRIICDEEKSTQFDEQIRLINASDEQEALLKAKNIGFMEEDSFLNSSQKQVNWKFINVSELYKLNTISDGVEIFASTEERDEAEVYVNFIHQKAEAIQQRVYKQVLTV
jgi:hypothetical protein